MISQEAEQVMVAMARGAELEFSDKWTLTENGKTSIIATEIINELIAAGFIAKEPLTEVFHESIEAIEDGIAENVRLGYLKDNGDGTFSVTEAGIIRAQSLLKKR